MRMDPPLIPCYIANQKRATEVTLRTRIIAGFVLLAAFLIAVDVYVAFFVYREQARALERQLNIRASQMLAPAQPLDSWVKSAVARAQATVTLFDRNGNVLAEAGQDVRTIEWPDQPEIRSALPGNCAGGLGRSGTIGGQFL